MWIGWCILCLCLTEMKHSMSDKILNSRPIVGIVAQETSDKIKKYYPKYSIYIAASYVKAMESSGVRVVPVLVNQEESYYR